MVIYRRRRGRPIGLSAQAATPQEGFILLEDGSYLLLESGDRIPLEGSADILSGSVLLESGDYLLLEDGSQLLFEG